MGVEIKIVHSGVVEAEGRFFPRVMLSDGRRLVRQWPASSKEAAVETGKVFTGLAVSALPSAEWYYEIESVPVMEDVMRQSLPWII